MERGSIICSEILARQELRVKATVQPVGHGTDRSSVPELVEDVCHVDTLRTLVRPAEPSFIIGGEVLFNRFSLENPQSTLRDGQGRLALDYSLK